MAHKLASEAALCYNKLRNNVALAMLETSQGWISLYERNTMNTLPPRAQDDNPPQKRCPKCHRWLPFSAFSTANAAKDGLYWRCRECKNARQKEIRTQDPERPRRYRLRYLFGITPQRYNQMLIEQGGVCAACGMPETHLDTHSGNIRFLSVDHDHKTGDVRALLCDACNVALGRLNEDPNRIRALADYAEWCQTLKPSIKIVQLPLLEQHTSQEG